jgi:hypothetical protein
MPILDVTEICLLGGFALIVLSFCLVAIDVKRSYRTHLADVLVLMLILSLPYFFIRTIAQEISAKIVWGGSPCM